MHEDYGYEYQQMDIEVFIKRGSKTEKADKDRADIVIYSSADKKLYAKSKNVKLFADITEDIVCIL